ncbi:MAG: hypothetical protein ACI9GK_003218, partial [Devosia sp.]
ARKINNLTPHTEPCVAQFVCQIAAHIVASPDTDFTPDIPI